MESVASSETPNGVGVCWVNLTATTPEEAELKALATGVQLCRTIRVNKLLIEGDCHLLSIFSPTETNLVLKVYAYLEEAGGKLNHV